MNAVVFPNPELIAVPPNVVISETLNSEAHKKRVQEIGELIYDKLKTMVEQGTVNSYNSSNDFFQNYAKLVPESMKKENEPGNYKEVWNNQRDKFFAEQVAEEGVESGETPKMILKAYSLDTTDPKKPLDSAALPAHRLALSNHIVRHTLAEYVVKNDLVGVMPNLGINDKGVATFDEWIKVASQQSFKKDIIKGAGITFDDKGNFNGDWKQVKENISTFTNTAFNKPDNLTAVVLLTRKMHIK